MTGSKAVTDTLTTGSGTASLLRPGETCWRRAHARRLAVLVDGDAYFRALRSAIIRAERSIMILAWEFHARTDLFPGNDAGDGWPSCLADLLLEAVRRKPALEVRILAWKHSVLFALEREFPPTLLLPWNRHPRITFRLDDTHPPVASHHQKVVVIDDRIAFCGGLDVSANRWDTPEHRPEDPRRVNPAGRIYGPFHDVQVAVDDAAATALGDLARERWRRATGVALVAPEGASDPWPEWLLPDMGDIEVGVARTEPAWAGAPGAREVERLYLESLRQAKRHVYIENQYLTSDSIAEALVESLSGHRGPEVVLVVPLRASGWLEEPTMGVARARLLQRLRAADRHRRLAVFHPVGPDGTRVNLHSKVMVVDDALLRIGSSNLANRSMGLDTECDIAVEAQERADIAVAVTGVRNRLLSEHLGCRPGDVAAAISRTGSLIGAIEWLRGGERTLRPLRLSDRTTGSWVPETRVFDPDHPVDPAELILEAVPPWSRLLWRNGKAA
ncbi:phospholipase D-like domain-containing protein [Arenibaculum pallidiluteum]|uniref:phospholipase D-like domain-containing protein n=1 Tax=Arenibaculum pallidiluteum TaxID=2812559 RepID=UPI001A964DDD|nr:phospholipase D-like domain-containing protein [Arenibaculum pallidiluteum]